MRGPFDIRQPQGVIVGRVLRAFGNLRETYPLFVGLALAVTVTGRADGLSAAGAHVWFWARVAHWPLYVFGVPYVRSAAFLVSVAGLLMMLWTLAL